MENTKNLGNTNIAGLVRYVIDEVNEVYWKPIFAYIRNNQHLVKRVPGYLINPDKVIIYISRTHIGIEYYGPESLDAMPDDNPINIQIMICLNSDQGILDNIIGLDFNDATIDLKMPLPEYTEDLFHPSNRGMDKLIELGWHFRAQDSIMTFNTSGFLPMPGVFSRLVNGFFFDCDKNNGLITRHVKWLDLIPISYKKKDDGSEELRMNFGCLANRVESDARFQLNLPNDYKYKKLPIINRFIELWGNSQSYEPEITRFLAEKEHEFIITMKFGATKVHSEKLCEWQSENKTPIKPDFLIENSDGFVDIVEFKLPFFDKNMVVGSENRETFSAFLNSYISQTRVYAEYFDDPNNRKWVKEKYGFDVYKPKRWLVVGRRSYFDKVEWRKILADYRDLNILTYDDLIDSVIVQFYK